MALLLDFVTAIEGTTEVAVGIRKYGPHFKLKIKYFVISAKYNIIHV